MKYLALGEILGVEKAFIWTHDTSLGGYSRR